MKIVKKKACQEFGKKIFNEKENTTHTMKYYKILYEML